MELKGSSSSSTVFSSSTLNPLHGVEREFYRLVPTSPCHWIHYMELKVKIQGCDWKAWMRIHYMELKDSNTVPDQTPLMLNPLHGVESRVLSNPSRPDLTLSRIHYMELKDIFPGAHTQTSQLWLENPLHGVERVVVLVLGVVLGCLWKKESITWSWKICCIWC